MSMETAGKHSYLILGLRSTLCFMAVNNNVVKSGYAAHKTLGLSY